MSIPLFFFFLISLYNTYHSVKDFWSFYGPHIRILTQLGDLLWSVFSRVQGLLPKMTQRQNMVKGQWKIQTSSPYIPRNNSPLERNPTEGPGIEPTVLDCYHWTKRPYLYHSYYIVVIILLLIIVIIIMLLFKTILHRI